MPTEEFHVGPGKYVNFHYIFLNQYLCSFVFVLLLSRCQGQCIYCQIGKPTDISTPAIYCTAYMYNTVQ